MYDFDTFGLKFEKSAIYVDNEMERLQLELAKMQKFNKASMKLAKKPIIFCEI